MAENGRTSDMKSRNAPTRDQMMPNSHRFIPVTEELG
jgi:hypothetical protein